MSQGSYDQNMTVSVLSSDFWTADPDWICHIFRTNNNSNVLFYVLFVQIGAHSHSQIEFTQKYSTDTHTHTHTRARAHTRAQYDSLKRWDFQDDLKKVSVFDDLTLQDGWSELLILLCQTLFYGTWS